MVPLNFLFLLLNILFYKTDNNCTSNSFYNAPGHIQESQFTDSINWINSFREFRNAVYQNNRNKVKEFIDFPIVNDNNEIWYLAYGNNDTLINTISHEAQPFTEKDFDKYFDKIFTKKFINAVLKIKTEELYRKGKTETGEFNGDKKTTYKMYATFDTEAQTLELNLATKTEIRSEDDGEFNILYQFVILKTGQLKFRQIRLAG